ncbi:MAG: hypothetical protein JXR03_14045 [Cyclobacteriaceae bacterium]
MMDSTNQIHTVEYDGHCAFAVSTGKMDVAAGNHDLKIDGKTYLFSNPIAKFLFKLLPNRIQKADSNWKNR